MQRYRGFSERNREINCWFPCGRFIAFGIADKKRWIKEQGRYETLLVMRMNNEIPKEVFCRKQQEVEKRIAELEQQMMQYGDVKHKKAGTYLVASDIF